MRLTAVFLSSLPVAFSARVTLFIGASTTIPNPSTLPPTTHATLSSPNGLFSAPLNQQNTFVFNNVTSGSYVASVTCRDYVFEPLRVDVSDLETGQKIQVWQTFRGNEWDNVGEKRADAANEVLVDVRVSGAKDYYLQRGGCK
jgi:ER membrane protein complex subunit 7